MRAIKRLFWLVCGVMLIAGGVYFFAARPESPIVPRPSENQAPPESQTATAPDVFTLSGFPATGTPLAGAAGDFVDGQGRIVRSVRTDAAGRVVRETRWHEGQSYAVEWTYDESGRKRREIQSRNGIVQTEHTFQ